MNSGDFNVNDFIRNSALKVELIDGEYYVPPASIEPGEEETDIAIGETVTLTANVSPANTTIATVIWSSSDNNVATVNQSGVVTRVGEGSATITARTMANNLTATFTIAPFNIDELKYSIDDGVLLASLHGSSLRGRELKLRVSDNRNVYDVDFDIISNSLARASVPVTASNQAVSLGMFILEVFVDGVRVNY
jgi:uncharacterized protein YjdB